jgi:hypothetical protein
LTLLKGTIHAAASTPSQAILRSFSNKIISISYNQTFWSILSNFDSDSTNKSCALL